MSGLKQGDDHELTDLASRPTRSRLVVIADKVPWPPYAGDKVRLLQLLEHAPDPWEVHLICPCLLADAAAASAELEARGIHTHLAPAASARVSPWSRMRCWCRGEPILCAKSACPGMRLAVERLLATLEFQAILVYRLGAVQHLPARLPNVPVVLDLVDANFPLLLEQRRDLKRWRSRAISTIDAWVSRWYERRLCSRFSFTVVSSQSETVAFDGVACPPRVLPNGVDLCKYPLCSHADERPGQMVMVGVWSYFPNLDAADWFCGAVLPKIVEACPEAHLDLVGPAPEKIAHLAGDSVTVRGEVDDLGPFVRRAAVVPLPYRHGTGTRLKLIEAMAQGKAIVSTSRGVRDIQVCHGESVLIADDAEGFAAAVCALLHSPDRRRALGRAARAVAERDHDARTLARTLYAWLDAETAHRHAE